jgi:hypothetical protein
VSALRRNASQTVTAKNMAAIHKQNQRFTPIVGATLGSREGTLVLPRRSSGLSGTPNSSQTLRHIAIKATRHGLPRFSVQLLLGPQFRPLAANQVQELLAQRWAPAGIKLPEGPLSPEVVASLIRMTGGNFRLLTRLLTQIERVLSVNNLHHVSVEVVEAARDSLVIGTN